MGKSITEEINIALHILQSGGVILYPTDTIWGLGCDALNPKAIDRVYAIKQRKAEKSLIILLDDFNKIQQYVNCVPPVYPDILNNPERPVTVIYNGAKNLPENLMAHDKTIAIRVVKDDFCSMLIQKLGGPLISTSANVSGEPAPIGFNHIADTIKNQVDYSVKLYRDRIGRSKPSTIIHLHEDGTYTVIRE